MSKKEAYRKINEKLKANEEKNGGPNNRNIDKQLKLVAMEMGKLNGNLLKASEQVDQEKFKVYFQGAKNNLAALGARVVAALDYLERNFDENGQPKEKENN